MLRKKQRLEIIDSSINRFNFNEDPSSLPTWFVEDEQRNYRPNVPITKEEVAEQKRLLKEYNERPVKKIAEAKIRKKKWLAKAMAKVKAKA